MQSKQARTKTKTIHLNTSPLNQLDAAIWSAREEARGQVALKKKQKSFSCSANDFSDLWLLGPGLWYKGHPHPEIDGQFRSKSQNERKKQNFQQI